MAYRIIGDLGGTNLRLAIVDTQEKNIVAQEKVLCADFPSLAPALKAFVDKYPQYAHDGHGVIAVAAALSNDWVEMTNNNWRFSMKDTANSLGFKHLLFPNDFEAIALGLPYLKENQILKIGRGEAVKGAPKVVFGAGTGLGTSYCYPLKNGEYVAISTEMGFSTFGGYTDREVAIVEKVRQQSGELIAENFLSGSGLVNIYRALAALDGANALYQDAAMITENMNHDKRCQETVDTFLSFLGIFAANVFLAINAQGGVYIAGGIAQKLQHQLLQSRFRESFEKRGLSRGGALAHNHLICQAPTYLMSDDIPALSGLMFAALNRF